jgi:hypothetical protein
VEFSRPIPAAPRLARNQARESATDQAFADDSKRTGKRSDLFAGRAASLPANPEAELYGRA